MNFCLVFVEVEHGKVDEGGDIILLDKIGGNSPLHQLLNRTIRHYLPQNHIDIAQFNHLIFQLKILIRNTIIGFSQFDPQVQRIALLQVVRIVDDCGQFNKLISVGLAVFEGCLVVSSLAYLFYDHGQFVNIVLYVLHQPGIEGKALFYKKAVELFGFLYSVLLDVLGQG